MRSVFLVKYLPAFYSIIISFIVINSQANAAVVGAQMTVNDYRPGHQVLVASVAAGNGNKIILWSDDTRGSACFIQVLDNQGTHQFTTEVLTGFKCVDVAADRVGNFIVTTNESDGSGRGIYARMYDRFGNSIANSIRVNDTVASDQFGGVITIGADGKFVIGWGQWNAVRTIELYFKVFNANGQAVTTQTLIANNSSNQSIDDILLQTNGNIVVTYSSLLSNDFDVWLRRFYSTGTANGSAIRVNNYRTNIQTNSKLATNAQGQLLVTWDTYRQDGDGWSCYSQLLDSYGTTLGSATRLTTELSSYQPICEVGMADDGSFAVAWQQSYIQPQYRVDIRSREFSNTAQPIAPESTITASVGEYISVPKIAMDLVGNYLVSWRSYSSSNDGYEVKAQRFSLANRPDVITLNNNTTINNLQSDGRKWMYYKLNIPNYTSTLVVNIIGGGTGNADLYINYGSLPTLTNSDIKSTGSNSSEAVSITTPPAGDMYIGIYANESFSNVQLNAYFY